VKSVAVSAASASGPPAAVPDLYRTAEPDGTFCDTFFKATAIRRED
jgi:hypothetical protein